MSGQTIALIAFGFVVGVGVLLGLVELLVRYVERRVDRRRKGP